MEASSLSVACDVDSESDTNVTYADVVKKEKNISQYQVEDENAALKIALEQSMAKVYWFVELAIPVKRHTTGYWLSYLLSQIDCTHMQFDFCASILVLHYITNTG